MNVIAPTINVTFNNEMLYNKDESIRGDNIVIPRGADVLIRGRRSGRIRFPGHKPDRQPDHHVPMRRCCVTARWNCRSTTWCPPTRC